MLLVRLGRIAACVNVVDPCPHLRGTEFDEGRRDIWESPMTAQGSHERWSETIALVSPENKARQFWARAQFLRDEVDMAQRQLPWQTLFQ
jgi:hypothetical protein